MRRCAWICLLSICVSQTVALAQYTPPEGEGTSKILGRLRDADSKPIAGAHLLAVHLSSGQIFSSDPTPAKGEFKLLALPYGYYDLAVETADGLFVADRTINLAPAGTAALELTILAFDATTATQARRHPGSDREPAGIVTLGSRAKGRDFWRSPKGVAVIAGVAGAGLLVLASTDDTETQITPF